MRCPTLGDLPPPPPGKTGWPWTEESSQLPDRLPDGASWPRISVVTPSYNQAQYLEETLRSVLLQGYPNLEFIVIDGASTDGSLEIIKKYANWLDYWISEPDEGHANALNKGFSKCTGDLFGWINSDDLLLPDATSHLATAFRQSPRSVLLGDVINIYEHHGFSQLVRAHNVSLQTLVEPWRYESNMFWHQPGVYVPRDIQAKIGPLDESVFYMFDWDWMCRLVRAAPVHYLHVPIAKFRFQEESKTVHGAPNWSKDLDVVVNRYAGEVEGFDQKLFKAALELHDASLHLRLHYWDRRRGVNHLIKAIQTDGRALMLPGFISACFRAISPQIALRVARIVHHQILRRNSVPD